MKPNIGITIFLGITIARNHIPKNVKRRGGGSKFIRIGPWAYESSN